MIILGMLAGINSKVKVRGEGGYGWFSLSASVFVVAQKTVVLYTPPSTG
jgi:hypothetical protein